MLQAAHKGLWLQAQTSAEQPTGQGWIWLSLHPDTMRTEESPNIVHLAPCKATSEEKGAKVFVGSEPNNLDVEFSP